MSPPSAQDWLGSLSLSKEESQPRQQWVTGRWAEVGQRGRGWCREPEGTRTLGCVRKKEWEYRWEETGPSAEPACSARPSQGCKVSTQTGGQGIKRAPNPTPLGEAAQGGRHMLAFRTLKDPSPKLPLIWEELVARPTSEACIWKMGYVVLWRQNDLPMNSSVLPPIQGLQRWPHPPLMRFCTRLSATPHTLKAQQGGH